MAEKKKKNPVTIDEIKVDADEPVLERIKRPIIWGSIAGLMVHDLQPDMYEQAIQLLRDHYFEDEVMCRGLSMAQDEESMEELLRLAHYWMKDTQSLVATRGDQLLGLLVGRVVDQPSRLRTLSRMSIYKGLTLLQFQKLRMHLHKNVDVFEKMDVDSYYRFYLWLVHPNWRNKGVGTALAKAAITLVRTMKLEVLTGIFTSAVSKHIVDKLGFQLLGEVFYANWLQDDKEVFSSDVGPGNYSAAVLAVKLVPPRPPTPRPEPPPPRRSNPRPLPPNSNPST